MAKIIDVVFKSHGIVAFFDDNTKVEGIYRNESGRPRIIGISEQQRNAIIAFYDKATPSTQADVRYLALIRANAALTTTEHTNIDHAGLTGIGGGAASGTPRRYYVPLQNAKLLDSSLVSITNATTPSIEWYDSTRRVRIVWPVGNTDRVAFTVGLPYEDFNLGGASQSLSMILHVALSQSGTEVIDIATTLNVDITGGGSTSGSSTAAGWSGLSGTIETRTPEERSDFGLAITDTRQAFITIKPDSAPSTDLLYLNSAWVEVDLK